MIHVLLVENDKNTVDSVISYCSQVKYIKVEKIVPSFLQANRFLSRNAVDLIICSTMIQDIQALEFVQNFSSNSYMFVFISDVPDFAINAFDLNVVDYLLKPLNQNRFNQMLVKVNEKYRFKKSHFQESNKFIQVRSEYSLIKINVNEIIFIESLDDYIKIHLFGKKPIMTLMSLKQVQTQLPESEFIRVHRSYLVAIHKIESVRGKVINLGAKELPIGKSYEAEFYKQYVNKTY